MGGLDKENPGGIVMNRVQLRDGGLENGEYTATVKISGYSDFPENVPEIMNPLSLRDSKWQMSVTANIDQSCLAGPHADGCAMEGLIKGKVDGRKLNHAVRFANSDGTLFTFEMESPKSTSLVSVGLSDVVEVNYETTGKPNRLVVRLPNLASPIMRQSLNDTLTAALRPFRSYIEAAITDPNTAAHALVWVDQKLATFTNEFDCSALFAATKFESDFIADKHGLLSVQDFVQSECRRGNQIVIEGIAETAIPSIESARVYVHKLTDENVGGLRYNKWARSHGF